MLYLKSANQIISEIDSTKNMHKLGAGFVVNKYRFFMFGRGYLVASVGNSVVSCSKVRPIHFTLRLKFTLLFMLPILFWNESKKNISPNQLNYSSRHLNLKWQSWMSLFFIIKYISSFSEMGSFGNKPFRELLSFALFTMTGSASRLL